MDRRLPPPAPPPIEEMPVTSRVTREVDAPSRLESIRRDPNWVLLVLRAFLAFTFLYAGTSKIGDRTFLDDNSPAGIHATVVAVKANSPIGGLLGPVVDHSFAFGLLMAFAEIAVGIGMLFGLFTRIAAVGGMLLALSLFLTVSWGADPWYTGADIVYVFAFTPLLLAGPTPYSVDEWLIRVRERHPGTSEDRTRRSVLAGGAVLVGLITVGTSALFRSSKDDDANGGSAQTPDATASGQTLIAAADVPVGGGKSVKAGSSGEQIWVLQLESGDFTAFNATCPHQQCAVNFVSKSDGFLCPCHQSAFDSSGKLTRGPATRGLTEVPVKSSGGQIVES
jgi:thiosulfate dehydrogenase [quinone] large subunit